MKHQYFGDVNDFLKYGLLRSLGRASGLRVGVAWMLTPDDDRPDGSRTAYWKDEAWRAHDPELFGRLKRLETQPSARNVELFRRWSLVPEAVDFDALLGDSAEAREAWMAEALAALADCPLLFFDPDNGFEVASVPYGRKGSSKYFFWSEAAAAWEAGHSLLVYQHYPREERAAFEAALVERARGHLPGARLTTFRTAHVVFLLAARAGHAEALARGTEAASRQWEGRLEAELRDDAAAGEVGRADRAGDLAAVCEALAREGPGAARTTLAGRYPFVAIAAGRRGHSELEMLRVAVRDGFLDRYDGTRLVFPGMLRLLSLRLPEEFPYHPNWKVDATHPAYWQLHPTLDHVTPVARGGADEPSNWVTTSQQHHSAKAHWTLAELGWTLHPSGTVADWDGLTGAFRAELAAHPELRRHPSLRKWAVLLDRVLPPG